MGEQGTTTRAGTGPVGRERRRTRTGRRLGSALWAVGLTAAILVGAAVGQWLVWAGVVLVMASVTAVACLVGGAWHRAGSATAASVLGFGLMLFAGPALYEVYMKSVGDPVPAVVTRVSESGGRHSPLRCALRETDGARRAYEVSQQQNCFGQAKVGDRVEIRVDPLGVLEPRLPDSSDQEGTTDITVGISAVLALLTAATVFHAGCRRRDG